MELSDLILTEEQLKGFNIIATLSHSRIYRTRIIHPRTKGYRDGYRAGYEAARAEQRKRNNLEGK